MFLKPDGFHIETQRNHLHAIITVGEGPETKVVLDENNSNGSLPLRELGPPSKFNQPFIKEDRLKCNDKMLSSANEFQACSVFISLHASGSNT